MQTNPDGAMAGSLPTTWRMIDEWYSFIPSNLPDRDEVLISLDEKTYNPGQWNGADLAMGDWHPIAWKRTVGSGRSFYSAIGHMPDVYQTREHRELLSFAIGWVARRSRHIDH